MEDHSISNVQGCFEAGDKSSLIWREDLISPVVAAKLFSNRKSNLPPSKEGGREIAIVRTEKMFGSGRYFR